MNERHTTGWGLWLPFRVDREAVWALDLQPERCSMQELEWHLDWQGWSHDGLPFSITPSDVWENPGLYQDQATRTITADLAWPIHATAWNGRLTILDGVHRLLRAAMDGRSEIVVKKLTSVDLRAVRRPAAEVAA